MLNVEKKWINLFGDGKTGEKNNTDTQG